MLRLIKVIAGVGAFTKTDDVGRSEPNPRQLRLAPGQLVSAAGKEISESAVRVTEVNSEERGWILASTHRCRQPGILAAVAADGS